MPEVSADDLPKLAPLPIQFSGSVPMYGSGSGFGSVGSAVGSVPGAFLQGQQQQVQQRGGQMKMGTSNGNVSPMMLQQSQQYNMMNMNPALVQQLYAQQQRSAAQQMQTQFLKQPLNLMSFQSGVSPVITQQQLMQQDALLQQERQRIMNAQEQLYNAYNYGNSVAAGNQQQQLQPMVSNQQPFLSSARSAGGSASGGPTSGAMLLQRGMTNNAQQSANKNVASSPLSFLQQRSQERFCYCPCMFGA
ncbi:unnamed protein product [Amoebophrya sp. A120]|nr:unnamed protein product [Amoebophrya sp. A120]|eukprot:GSA120T00007835001.1